ncbi:hypothetical protein HME01_24920 [Vreelandella aquamarina]|nr:hypothetical protein HME01_24920 [Halomonas meridiana]
MEALSAIDGQAGTAQRRIFGHVDPPAVGAKACPVTAAAPTSSSETSSASKEPNMSDLSSSRDIALKR